MAHREISVTYKSTDTARIPDSLTEAASLLLDLAERGIVEEAGERVRIRRQGGYSGLDVWLFLLVLFTTGAQWGIRTLWEKKLRVHAKQLAALGGRAALISPASLSRALDAVEPELLRKASPWMLLDMPGVDELMTHPAAMSYDAHGHGWHVFDLDPTVETLRHRALPMDEELPEPRRRSEHTAAPGYAGRKRGEVQFRRLAVEHSGTSLWLHGHLSAGNGEGVVDLELGLDAVAQTCDRIGHARSRTLVRMDGEFGNVPGFVACRERALPFITRLSRQNLYKDPEVLQRLRSAVWHRVPDSLSGPIRSAADLGILRVAPGARTRRPDGSTYAPVDIRVVASILVPTEGKAKSGQLLDGWQVELFAVDVPADAWPAPDAIAMYFGRTAQENRFAQEDREAGLDRIISYHLPGQELAAIVGMSLWNYRVVQGFRNDPPPTRPPAQKPRSPRVDDRVPEHWPRDPVVQETLDALDWPTLLAHRPGWRWCTELAALTCEDGRELTLSSVRKTKHDAGWTGIVLRRPPGGCTDCSARPTCFVSTRENACMHAEFSIPTKAAVRLRERLEHVRNQARKEPTIKPVEASPGPLESLDSLFLPAAARQSYRDAFFGATLHIIVKQGPQRPPWSHLVARDKADRQRRRKTWQQNVDRYALPKGSKVSLTVAGSPRLRKMLGEPGASPRVQDTRRRLNRPGEVHA